MATARVAELEALKAALDAQLYTGELGLIAAQTAAQNVYDDASAAFEWALNDWAVCAMQSPVCEDQSVLMDRVKSRGTERAESAVALNTIKAVIADNRAQ